jgi:hypothetical protein
MAKPYRSWVLMLSRHQCRGCRRREDGSENVLIFKLVQRSWRPERIQVMLTMDELRAVDDWRFRRRMPSRASAIREILRIGLSAEGVVLAEEGARSHGYSILNGPSTPES